MSDHEREVNNRDPQPWKKPVGLSLALHGLIVLAVMVGWTFSPIQEPEPRSISARLISPQPVPSPEVEPEQDRQEELERQRQENASRSTPVCRGPF